MRNDEPRGTDRSFGLTVGGVFALFGSIRLGLRLREGAALPVDLPVASFLAVAAVLILLALVRPDSLALPNRLWSRFGFLLSRVMNPVVLLVFYVVCFLPIGILMRAFRYDPLQLRRRASATTWWVPHEPSPLEEPFRRQF